MSWRPGSSFKEAETVGNTAGCRRGRRCWGRPPGGLSCCPGALHGPEHHTGADGRVVDTGADG